MLSGQNSTRCVVCHQDRGHAPGCLIAWYVEQIDEINRLYRSARDELVHLRHCNFGEWEGSCKYGNPEDCPALTEWGWLREAYAKHGGDDE
jgi:hypothetical protein